MPLLRLSGLDALISFFIIFLKVEDCYVGALTGILNCIFHTYTPYVQLCRAFMSILFLYTYVLDFFFFFLKHCKLSTSILGLTAGYFLSSEQITTDISISIGSLIPPV